MAVDGPGEEVVLNGTTTLVLARKPDPPANAAKLEEVLYNIITEHMDPAKVVQALERESYRMGSSEKKNSYTLATETWFCPKDRIVCSKMDGQFRVRRGHVLNPFERVDAFDVLATYLPVMVLPQLSALTKSLSDAVLVLAVMVIAQDDWINTWRRTIPDELFNPELRSLMALGALRQLHNLAAFVDRRLLSKEQIHARIDLLYIIDKFGSFCPEACGARVLYDVETMMIPVDTVRPSAAFLCRDIMPGYRYYGDAICHEHVHPLIMVATRDIPEGRSPITVCWTNPMNAEDEELMEWRHPAMVHPLRTVKAPRAEALVTAFDRIEEMVHGSRHRIKLQGYAVCSSGGTVEKVRAAVKNLKKRAAAFGQYEEAGPKPSEDWPMALDVKSYRLLRLIGKMLWVLPVTTALFKECAELYKQYYIDKIHSMEWPVLIFDMVSACAMLMKDRPCETTRDLYHQAVAEFEIMDSVSETHHDMCERIALHAPFSSFYTTAFKIEGEGGQIHVLTHSGEPKAQQAK